jgi:hypothetical protein
LRAHGHHVRVVDGAVSRHDRLQSTARRLAEPSDHRRFRPPPTSTRCTRQEQIHAADRWPDRGRNDRTLNDRRFLERGDTSSSARRRSSPPVEACPVRLLVPCRSPGAARRS